MACRDEEGECACVNNALLCDGRFDCPQGEDEAHCLREPCSGGLLEGVILLRVEHMVISLFKFMYELNHTVS